MYVYVILYEYEGGLMRARDAALHLAINYLSRVPRTNQGPSLVPYSHITLLQYSEKLFPFKR